MEHFFGMSAVCTGAMVVTLPTLRRQRCRNGEVAARVQRFSTAFEKKNSPFVFFWCPATLHDSMSRAALRWVSSPAKSGPCPLS